MKSMNDREAILAVFTADLPETVRLLNPPAVTEEIAHGREVTVQDDELSPKEVYDRHEAVMEELEAEGILTSGDWHGVTAYGLTGEYVERYHGQVVGYLERKAVVFRRQMEEADGPEAKGPFLQKAMETEKVAALLKEGA